ncbi:MAG: hypothetical protein H5U02_09285 [Clostridia bacterium]|nr:hypothetical protein [Clostridia bacterium]
MKDFWNSDLFLKILSVAIAVGLWFYVAVATNPVRENVLDVPLEVRQLADNLVVAQKPSRVQVRVQGKGGTVDHVLPREIQAYLNLGGVHLGANTVPVQVTVPPSLKLVAVEPAQAEVIIDQKASRPVEVELVAKGKVAAGVQAAEPVLSPSQVTVSGPEAVLSQVQRIVAEVDLSGRNQDFRGEVPLRAQSKNGQYLDEWVEITPATASVWIPIVAEQPSRVLPVRVQVSGQVAPGYQVQRILVSPQTVVVFGPQNVLDQLLAINTEPIDISGAKRTITQEVKLQVPAQTNLPGTLQVMAVVEIGKTAGGA